MKPHLDRHRVRKEAGGSQSRLATRRASRSKIVASSISGNKISFEGILDGDRLRLPIGLNRLDRRARTPSSTNACA